ncbi:CvpA family protein [Thalassoroseus pseudoceratinae]|uniref:CvpA family protein n=1 Tax=Thalassoroseus pseudoceratinae TaxID=2713176 RepID=UPI001980A5D0|nr:CvpA family protein [Thalassoroseus pseudoceratinae]
MIAFILLGIMALVAWCVAGEGPWGAGITFLCVLFAGLLAMNFFEPLADMLASITNTGMWLYRWDYIALVGLFAAFVFGLREISNRLVPTFFQTEEIIYEIGRWGFGVLTGYVTMAFLLTALHTAPLPRTVTKTGIVEFLGFQAEKGNLFGFHPDRQWLGFTRFVSARGFARSDEQNRFDNPIYRIGGQGGPDNPWPSFPIRYAARREQLGGQVVAAPVPTTNPGPTNPSPTNNNAPAPSGGADGF